MEAPTTRAGKIAVPNFLSQGGDTTITTAAGRAPKPGAHNRAETRGTSTAPTSQKARREVTAMQSAMVPPWGRTTNTANSKGQGLAPKVPQLGGPGSPPGPLGGDLPGVLWTP